MAGKWVNVGTLRKGKKGNLYLKLDKALPAGAIVNLQKPVEALDRFLKMELISQEQYETRKAAIPEYIKYALFLTPNNKDES